MSKPKFALYWAASCGGCEIAVVQLYEKILDVAAAVDIVLWPVALDFKYHHLEAMEDRSIDVCLFNGGLRTSENEHIATLLRQKSKVMVAFGACATMGGVPGLANLHNRERVFQHVYHDSFSTVNDNGTRPQLSTMVKEGELRLPEFYDSVMPLDGAVEVEYYVPGCPPTAENVWAVLQVVLKGELPPPPAVAGALEKTCCDECELTKEEKKIKRFHRPYEIIPDPKKCLLEQGIVCCGPATRAGCGAQCTKALMPCRGCYGPTAGVKDPGMKLISAISSVIDSDDPKEIAAIVDQIKDPVGTFYRFGLPASMLRRARLEPARA